MELVSRFFSKPETSFFLFGPRGTGKTTWLRAAFKDPIYIDLLDPEKFRLFSARPERLKELIKAQQDKKSIIIDEVQKVPTLLDVVHQLIERNKELNFVLTGSSARKIKQSGVDLLSGRALLKTMHPFMASELGRSFNLDEALQLGMVPLIRFSAEPLAARNAYASLYLREEVQAEGLTRNLGSFSRFLEAISFSHGSVLNTSEVARECQVGRKTVEGYISILEDLLLSFRLPVFTRRAKRIIIAHSKFYFFDAGIFRSLRPSGPLDSSHDIDGGALEGLVGQQLRAWISYSNAPAKLFFWRTKSGNEVDFVVYGPDCFHALEVKNSRTVRAKYLTGLKSFLEDYPQAKGLYLYRGRERLKIGRILCLPCDEFLSALKPDQPLPG